MKMSKNTNNKKTGQQILEGSRAIALTIKNIGVQVVSAYPITPQTHIVEDLAQFKADGQANYEYARAESEFAAASIVLGASATGVRAYSATSSQGLLLMTEVLYNISGLRLPVVMTCANRSISSPINIWNDHADVMAIKDSGWLQFFAENHQEAVYAHLLAYKVAEQIALPAMVNVDGFILTHSYEPVSIPDKKLIKKYLPDYKPAKGTFLDPKNPVTLGALFGPDSYTGVRKDLHQDFQASLTLIKKEYALLKKIFKIKNNSDGLIEYTGPKKPKTILITMGSLAGTIKTVLAQYPNVGLIKIMTLRPFPEQELIKATMPNSNIIILEKAVSPGSGGPLALEIKAALSGQKKNIKNYIVGLGGRNISEKEIRDIINKAEQKNKNLIFQK